MQSFDQSLHFLFEKSLITYDEALKWASNPDEFKLRKIGIQSTKDMAMEEMESSMSEIKEDEAPGLDQSFGLAEDHAHPARRIDWPGL